MDLQDTNPQAKIHHKDTDELVEEYGELMDILKYGEPDAVSVETKRKFERLQAELIYRLMQEVLLEDSGEDS